MDGRDGIGGRTGSDVVVLVHGLGRTHRSMAFAAWWLKREGFGVVRWRYASWRRGVGVEAHAAALREALRAIAAEEGVRRVHVVTHSMGGVITRAALARDAEAIPKLGRVVMLAPPHRGSRLARLAARVLPVAVVPRALRELSDAPESLVNTLPGAAVETGIIAGCFDGKVPIANTHLVGESDHLVVPAFHTWIAWRADVMRAAVRFLRAGTFRAVANPQR